MNNESEEKSQRSYSHISARSRRSTRRLSETLERRQQHLQSLSSKQSKLQSFRDSESKLRNIGREMPSTSHTYLYWSGGAGNEERIDPTNTTSAPARTNSASSSTASLLTGRCIKDCIGHRHKVLAVSTTGLDGGRRFICHQYP